MKGLGVLLGVGILGYLAYRSGLFGGVASSSPSIPGPSNPPAPQLPSAASNSAVQLATLYAQILGTATAAAKSGVTVNGLGIQNGVTFANFDAWNYYLGQLIPWTLPGYQDLTKTPDPNTPISSQAYWLLMAPWLSSNHGLSGLGAYFTGNPARLIPHPVRWSPAYSPFNRPGWGA